jgi:hypothetical protein
MELDIGHDRFRRAAEAQAETAAPPRKRYSATARSMLRSQSDWTTTRSGSPGCPHAGTRRLVSSGLNELPASGRYGRLLPSTRPTRRGRRASPTAVTRMIPSSSVAGWDAQSLPKVPVRHSAHGPRGPVQLRPLRHFQSSRTAEPETPGDSGVPGSASSRSSGRDDDVLDLRHVPAGGRRCLLRAAAALAAVHVRRVPVPPIVWRCRPRGLGVLERPRLRVTRPTVRESQMTR